MDWLLDYHLNPNYLIIFAQFNPSIQVDNLIQHYLCNHAHQAINFLIEFSSQ